LENLATILAKLWQDYSTLNPQAGKIHTLLTGRGEIFDNDHIAFRTLAHPGIDISSMGAPFLALGYRLVGKYDFPEKKLDAVHFEHTVPGIPKIFISQLRIQELSQGARSILLGLINQIPPSFLATSDWYMRGRPWDLDFITYEALERESDYAAWLAAFGFRPNHFTVLTNHLKTFSDLPALNQFLQAHGFELNSSGGEIKGNRDVYLEQSSTLANQVEVQFREGRHIIPGCYYEFARRYPLADGKLFQGFIAASANRIFESTDRKAR
jgi:Domain of unknown function (DUF1338)